MIKTWEQRCEEHPNHQSGMVSHGMIQARMQEEIDDLRAALAQPEPDHYGDFDKLQNEIADTPEYKEAQEWAKQTLAQPEPTRSQQMRDAGYTRRPRQLPEEDEQEPVAIALNTGTKQGVKWNRLVEDGTPLYTHPPQRKPLTEEEIYKLFGYDNQYGVVPGYALSFVRAVEKAHGIGGDV